MARREDYDIVLRATDQTSAAFAAAERNAASLNGAVGILRGGLAGLAGVLVGDQLVSFAHEAVSSLAAVGNSAKTVGVTTDALQALRFAVEQGGGTASDADAALRRFADTMGKAGTGANYLGKVLAANHVALRDANGQYKTADQLLVDYARLVDNAETPQKALFLTTQALGREAGPQMLSVMQQIARQGLPAVIKGAQDAGAVIDRALIDKADEIDKKWNATSTRIANYLKSAVVQAADQLQDDPLIGPLSRGEKVEWSAVLRVDLIPGGPLDKLWQFIRPGAAAALGEPTPSFTDRFADAQQPNTGAVAVLRDYLRIVNQVNDAVAGWNFSAASTRLPLANDALQKQIDTISKHIAQTEADARTVGATAGAQAELRVRTQLLEAAQQHGIPVAGAYAKQIDDLAARARGAADALALAKLQSDVAFQRSQLGRTGYQADAAAQLRSAGIDANSAQGQALAQQIELNAALSDTKQLSSDVLKTMVADWRANKNGAEIFLDVLGKVADKLQSLAIDALTSALFKPLLGGLTGTAGAAGSAGTLGGTGLLGFGGFYAAGGYLPPGQWGVAGERGPEPIFGGKTGLTVQGRGDGGAAIAIADNSVNHFNSAISGSDRTWIANAIKTAVGASESRMRDYVAKVKARQA